MWHQPSAIAIDGAGMLFWMTVTYLLHPFASGLPWEKMEGMWWWPFLSSIRAGFQCWILGIDVSCTGEVQGSWHEVFHHIRTVCLEFWQP